MIRIITLLIKTILTLLFNKRERLITQILILKKENSILKRNQKGRIYFTKQDRRFFIFLHKCSSFVKQYISIIKPETLLRWTRKYANKRENINMTQKIGRPPIPNHIKELVLEIKNSNLNWGYKKIQGELLKLNISLDTKTIRNIIISYRKKGKVKTGLTWRKFLNTHINSIFAMDFFTVDTIFQKRYYIHFIISHKTREIIQYAITTNPTREFVRQQFIEFSDKLHSTVYMIHDRAKAFLFKYSDYGMKSVPISVKAPNMNAIAERVVKTIRKEALDNFIILNQKQLKRILDEYIKYYNSKRPHQGIKQAIPAGYTPL